MKQFDYEKVNTPIEASNELSGGEDESECRLIAGGTALVIMMKEGILAPDKLLDISQIESMRGISFDEGKGLRIGSMVTHLEIEQSEIVARYYPSLKDAFHSIGNVRIRSVGTIGGNLAYAEPQCNPPTILAALGAEIHAVSTEGERRITADSFILGIFESALKQGEVITEISIPPPKPNSSSYFFKFTPKSETDKPTSAVATYLRLDASSTKVEECKIVVGAVGPKTYRCHKAENFVRNAQRVTEIDLTRAAELAAEEFEVMDDLYGPSWYKKRVTKSIIRDSLERTIDNLMSRNYAK